ncbi:MAG: TetR/AcrR family transcriptional repressor of nem operon [Alphaproteobacteria bacterium]|jgi:TetR/AcrR family transcriptional repressor of nem operon
MGIILRDLDLGEIGKTKPDKRGYIGDRESGTRKIRLSRENAVQIAHPGKRAVALMIAPFGALVALDIGSETRGRVMEIGGNGIENTGFGTALHHVDDRPFLRRPSGQGRLTGDVIEIFGDRGAFRNSRAIVQFQHRHGAARVLFKKRRCLVFTAGHVDLHELDLIGQVFFRQRDTDTCRIGKTFKLINLHFTVPPCVNKNHYLSVDRLHSLPYPTRQAYLVIDTDNYGNDMSDTIDRLLDAAETSIRLRGYHAVSFRELADDLGIKSSSVHYYFRQKEDLGHAVVERYAARVLSALADEAANAETPVDHLAALCAVYRQALKGSDSICLCGMLGAESAGLPTKLADAVATFFQANIDWIAAALPQTMTAKARRERATHILATLQGAMTVAATLKSHKVFDEAVRDLLASAQV